MTIDGNRFGLCQLIDYLAKNRLAISEAFLWETPGNILLKKGK